MDRLYDGNTHITLAPYIWAPNVKLNLQYQIPTLPGRPVRTLGTTLQTGPSNYVPKLNSALEFAFDARKGPVDFLGDVIYLNASTSATFAGTITGRRGRFHIPYTVDTNAHIAQAIWELALGATIARGHNADLSVFAGTRQLPITLTLGYSAIVGRRGIIAPSGGLTVSDSTGDFIIGLRGKAFLDNHLFVPYYIDTGTGSNNQTWQGYTGVGYGFNHGQTLIALWRALNYYDFLPESHTQRLSMGGPLLGYTFNL
jgi:hypothetical protein